tara:strand:- start:17762 stop:18262 length:501 start_codon:yes stop_codon:yes gene_type:complete
VDILNLTQPVSEKEVREMHIINQENIPEVGGLPEIKDFGDRVSWSANIFVYKYEDVIKAFVLCMREGMPYKSPNYEYISNEYKKFLYVDRIAVQEKFRRQGIAEEIYLTVINEGKRNNLDILCEVNTKPSNEPSLTFHQKMGFEEIGTNDFEKNSVVYLRRPFSKK